MPRKGGAPRPKTATTIVRQLHILRSIPIFPSCTGVKEVVVVLAELAIEVSARQVQRDLKDLTESVTGLMVVEEKPLEVAWASDAPFAVLAKLSDLQHCLLHLVQRHIDHALPPSLTDLLGPYFDKANRQGGGDWRFAGWPKKVRVEGLGFHPKSPQVDPVVQEQVYRALFDENVCRVTFQGPRDSKSAVLELHPLGLLLRDGVLTLVALEGSDREPRQFHLHRMKSAERLEKKRKAVAFDLSTFSGEDLFAPQLGQRMKLVIRFERDAPLYPEEKPLSDDMVVTDYDARRRELRATVPNTRYMVAWLRGYGPRIEVLEPKELRALFASEAGAASAMYRELRP